MNRKRVVAIAKRQWLETRHSPAAIFDILYWPFLDLLLWGLVTTFLERGGVDVPLPVRFLLGATMLWGLLFRGQLTVSLAFMVETWSRNLISLLASPLRAHEWLAGAMLWNVGQMAVSWTVMALLAWGLFSFSILQIGIALVPFVAVLMLFGVAMGLVVLGILLRFGHGADILAWGMAGLLSPLSATYYPLDVLPGWIQAVARALPPAHVFESMRTVLAGGPVPWDELALAGALDVLYIAAAAAFAMAMLGTLRRRGLAARYA